APPADNVHQFFSGKFVSIIDQVIGAIPGVKVLPGAGISDRKEKWTKNFRVPDVSVFLPGNPAKDRGTHYLGGPDFAVEIISKKDRSRKKFEFYAEVGVKEFLLVDRD